MNKVNMNHVIGRCQRCGATTSNEDGFKCPQGCEMPVSRLSDAVPMPSMPHGMNMSQPNIPSPMEFMQAMFVRMDVLEQKIDAVLANQNQQGMYKEPPSCKKGTKKCSQ